MNQIEQMYTLSDVRKLLQTDRDLHANVYDLFELLGDKAHDYEHAKQRIFDSLRLKDSLNWLSTLESYRTDFETKTDTLVDLIHSIGNENPPIQEQLSDLENFIKASASDLQDALRAAIADNDDGTALMTLGGQKLRSVLDSLQDLRVSMKTDDLHKDRRFNRGSLYIGNFCNQIEERKGGTIRQQWKECYRFLKSIQNRLEGDELSAWEWFTYKNPHPMSKDELHQFEQEISRAKNIAKTSDKVPTTI